MRILKYPLMVQDIQEIEMPSDSNILCVQAQLDTPVIWAEVQDEDNMTKIKFLTVVTGITMPAIQCTKNYIGTYQLHGGKFIGHVYLLSS